MPIFRTCQPVSAADPALPHLILVGLPGSGKSVVGRRVANALRRTFLDFDREIARREGATIPQIFALHGEGYFRDAEHLLTQDVRAMGNMVLAPGGGWMMRPETVALIRPPALLIYLEVTPATAVRRMGAGMAARPLLRGTDPVSELERLFELRKPSYEGADLTFNVESLAPHDVASQITKRVQNRTPPGGTKGGGTG